MSRWKLPGQHVRPWSLRLAGLLLAAVWFLVFESSLLTGMQEFGGTENAIFLLAAFGCVWSVLTSASLLGLLGSYSAFVVGVAVAALPRTGGDHHTGALIDCAIAVVTRTVVSGWRPLGDRKLPREPLGRRAHLHAVIALVAVAGCALSTTVLGRLSLSAGVGLAVLETVLPERSVSLRLRQP